MVVAVAAVVAGGEPADRGGEQQRRGECPERGREGEAVGEHQAGEGRGGDPVGVEGEAAEDDPGPEDPGAGGEQEDLPEPVLDEGEGEGFEHRQRRRGRGTVSAEETT